MAESIISPGVSITENDQSSITTGVVNAGAVIVGPTTKGRAFVPTLITNTSDFQAKFGNSLFYGKTSTYVPQTVNHYLQQANSVMVLRVLGNGNFGFNGTTRKAAALIHSQSNTIITVLYPSINEAAGIDLSGSNIPANSDLSSSFNLALSGSSFTATNISTSLLPSSPVYLTTFGAVVGTAPDNSIPTNTNGTITYSDAAWTYVNFKSRATALATGSLLCSVNTQPFIISGSASEGYGHGQSPWITNGNGAARLFKFHHLSDGFDTNKDVYCSITNLIEPADINGVQQYSKFTVLVRKVGDSDLQPSILESFNCDLNPDSPNYIAKQIGDKYESWNSTLQKVVPTGDFNSNSSFIRVEVADAVKAGAMSPKSSPRGFEALFSPVQGFGNYGVPTASMQTSPIYNSSYNPNVFLGFDFTNQDNWNYLNPTPYSGSSGAPSSTSGLFTNAAFNVGTLSGHPSASYTGSLSASVDTSGITGPTSQQVKFSVPFQGGTDGIDFSTPRQIASNITSTNAFGYNLSNGSAAGTLAYKKATDILSNKDKYDFSIIATPGVIKDLHSTVITNTLNMVEERGDAIYVIDLEEADATVANAKNATSGLDSSYAAVYYPWIKMTDIGTGSPAWFPPSVVIPGVFAKNDRIGAPWFAPAGLTRGGIPGVIDVKNPLSKAERDILYNDRVNPIAVFPSQGIVVYGQKTLQTAATSLDRINVRRLVIDLKKFVDAQSRFLVFEQNTESTRQRFLSAINPKLRNVKERQGLYAYKVVMDSSNNTSDVIDRNELVGAIYIQPTKTAEFIKIEFNIQPTGTQI